MEICRDGVQDKLGSIFGFAVQGSSDLPTVSAGPVIMHCTGLHVYCQHYTVGLLAEDLDLWQQQGATRQLVCIQRLHTTPLPGHAILPSHTPAHLAQRKAWISIAAGRYANASADMVGEDL